MGMPAQWRMLQRRQWRHCTTKLLLILVAINVSFAATISESNAHVEPVEVEVNVAGNVNKDPGGNEAHDEFTDYTVNKNSVLINHENPTEHAEPIAVEQQGPHAEESRSWSNTFYMITLQKELEAVDQLIDLQRRKVDALERLRAQTLAMTDKREAADINRAIDRQFDQLTAEYMAVLSGSRFDSHFVERAQITLHPDDVLVAVQMETLGELHSNAELIVLGYRSGEIVVYSSSPLPTELCRIQRVVDNVELVSLQLDVVSDPPVLAALYKSEVDPSLTTVVVYRLSRTPNDTNMYTLLYRIKPNHAVTAMAFARTSRRNVLTIASADGALAFYATNGTIVHKVDVQARHSIQTIAMRNSLVAFANGTATVLYTLSRQQQQPPTFRMCLGSLAMVTSIVFDTVDVEILFVGTADGEILAFSLGSKPGREQNTCTLVYREIVQRSSALSLQVLDGYVMASTYDRLSVFNVSRLSGTVSLKFVCSTQTLTSWHLYPAPFSITRGTLAITLGLVTSTHNAPPYFTLYQSLLSSPSNNDGLSGFDTSMLRGLWFICMIAVAVVVTQWYLRRSNDRVSWSQQGATSRNSGMSTDQEAAKWMAYLGQQRQSEMSSSSADFVPSTNKRYTPSKSSLLPDNFTAEDARRLLAGHQSKQRSKPSKTFTPSYDALSDDMRRKLAKARRETLECSFDDDQIKRFDT